MITTEKRSTPIKNHQKPWYRFIDDNRSYDYKSIHNAIVWAQKKVLSSSSKEIRIYKMNKTTRWLSMDPVAFVHVIQPRPARSSTFDKDIIFDELKTPEVITVWRDLDIYNEFYSKVEETN